MRLVDGLHADTLSCEQTLCRSRRYGKIGECFPSILCISAVLLSGPGQKYRSRAVDGLFAQPKVLVGDVQVLGARAVCIFDKVLGTGIQPLAIGPDEICSEGRGVK